MRLKKIFGMIFAGGVAGIVNGLFGAGGGMILVPTLSNYSDLEEHQVFPCSVSIILPICLISVCTNITDIESSFRQSTPYLIGGLLGGLAAGLWGHHIPTKYLHRVLGILIIWGGIRYLC